LSGEAVVELAGVVPRARIEALRALVRNEGGHGFGAVQAECRALVADGYAAKRVLAQLGAALLRVDAPRAELPVAQGLALLADAEFALLSGADEYLQLLDALSGVHALLLASPSSPHAAAAVVV
jgi:hypothetical protein